MNVDQNFSKLSDDEKTSKSYSACIPLGFGEIIGAYSTGIIADYRGPRVGSFYISFILVLVLVLSLISINSDKFNVLSYFMTFLWGAADGGTAVLLGKIAGI